jgi:hypothetical protein
VNEVINLNIAKSFADIPKKHKLGVWVASVAVECGKHGSLHVYSCFMHFTCLCPYLVFGMQR